MSYIAQNIVESIVDNSKGQFMRVIVDKKLQEGETVPVERSFVFKMCPTNAPTFKDSKQLRSIRESNGRWRSFDVGRVKYMRAFKTEISALRGG